MKNVDVNKYYFCLLVTQYVAYPLLIFIICLQ